MGGGGGGGEPLAHRDSCCQWFTVQLGHISGIYLVSIVTFSPHSYVRRVVLVSALVF